MALLQARGVNLLVLDEPTNHLDLPAIEQLEQALESYDGALLLVSHDRRLLDNVRLDQRWHVDGGRVVVRHGGDGPHDGPSEGPARRRPWRGLAAPEGVLSGHGAVQASSQRDPP